MKNRFSSRVLLLFVLVLVALFAVPLVAAKGLSQDEVPPVSAVTVQRAVDMTFLLLIVAFFKARTGWKGNAIIGVAFVTWLILYFQSDLAGLWPPFEPIIDCVKGFLGALGTYDFGMDVKEKFAKIDANA